MRHLAALLILTLCHCSEALDNGVGRTPVLGWSSWNFFTTNINETLIEQVADSLVSSGLRDVGFEYVNLDAGVWQRNRTNDGAIQEDRSKFPSGMKHLADYLHTRGLKLGLYTDLSSATRGMVCGTGPGSLGHYKEDMAAFAAIGADFLKVDYCAYDQADPSRYMPAITEQTSYWEDLRDALNATGRPIYLYACPRSFRDSKAPPCYDGPPRGWDRDLRRSLANSMLTEYRNSHDNWPSVLSNLDSLLDLGNLTWSEPGFWQDADMLQTCNFGHGSTGQGGMTFTEYAAQYVTWAILGSNLVFSLNPATLVSTYPECLALLKNREIVAVNQDVAGLSPQLLHQEDPSPNWQGFSRRLSDGSVAAVLLNRGESTMAVAVTWQNLGLAEKRCRVRDVVNSKDLGAFDGGFNMSVPKHGAGMIRVAC